MNSIDSREKFYAHTAPDGGGVETWQELETHLRNVARLAADKAEAFGARDWAYLAGLWHDLGKYRVEFQARLAGQDIRVDHSGPGAAWARHKLVKEAFPIAACIAGHHGGLPNLRKTEPGSRPLFDRLKTQDQAVDEIRRVAPPRILEPQKSPSMERLKPGASGDLKQSRRRLEMFTRFLFSTLVDADWLDTEEFCNPDKASQRGGYDDVETLARHLDDHIDRLVAGVPLNERNTTVNTARNEILIACRNSAAQWPGMFSLTVPTGGGKTLSAMSFALNHAVRHGLRRVIVVIPYTSIIEQNAAVYRDALNADQVITHHSGFDPERSGLEPVTAERHERASENWDAPIIVTTTVQFFESLFSSRPSRARKIHNIAKSMIILDEVQTLPSEYLLSITECLEELTVAYGCSVVLSTATPPALEKRNNGKFGITGLRPIIDKPEDLYKRLSRVEYHWPLPDDPPVDLEALGMELAEYEQVLAVVPRRKEARELAYFIGQEAEPSNVFHLSALMCPDHRIEVLDEVRLRLLENQPCRLVATPLVEAGVDVDFPVVYRALAGLDSVVQAAGRCNRNGRRAKGKVVIFRSPAGPVPGTPKKAFETTLSMLKSDEAPFNLDDPDIFDRFFRQLYFKESLDAKGVQTERQEFNFVTVDRLFKLIEDGHTETIVVPYGGGEEALDELRLYGPSRETFRKLQPFIVQVYPNDFQRLTKTGALEEVASGVFTLTPPFKHVYDKKFGLVVCDDMAPDPAALNV